MKSAGAAGGGCERVPDEEDPEKPGGLWNGVGRCVPHPFRIEPEIDGALWQLVAEMTIGRVRVPHPHILEGYGRPFEERRLRPPAAQSRFEQQGRKRQSEQGKE